MKSSSIRSATSTTQTKGSDQSPFIGILPTEVLEHISSFLDDKSRSNLMRVCTFWLHLICQSKLRDYPSQIELMPKRDYKTTNFSGLVLFAGNVFAFNSILNTCKLVAYSTSACQLVSKYEHAEINMDDYDKDRYTFFTNTQRQLFWLGNHYILNQPIIRKLADNVNAFFISQRDDCDFKSIYIACDGVFKRYKYTPSRIDDFSLHSISEPPFSENINDIWISTGSMYCITEKGKLYLINTDANNNCLGAGEDYDPHSDFIQILLPDEDPVKKFIGINDQSWCCILSSGRVFYIHDSTQNNTPTLLEFPKNIIVEDGISHHNSTFFITTERRIFAIGKNDTGQLGIGKINQQPIATPTQVLMPTKERIKQIVTCDGETFFVSESGKLFQCGAPKTELSDDYNLSPKQINLPEINTFFLVNTLKFCLTKGGELYQWRYPPHTTCQSEWETDSDSTEYFSAREDEEEETHVFENSTSSSINHMIPIKIELPRPSDKIFEKNGSIFCIGKDKKLYAWGENLKAIFGNDTPEYLITPTAIAVPADCDIIQITLYDPPQTKLIALTQTGEMLVWDGEGEVWNPFGGSLGRPLNRFKHKLTNSAINNMGYKPMQYYKHASFSNPPEQSATLTSATDPTLDVDYQNEGKEEEDPIQDLMSLSRNVKR